MRFILDVSKDGKYGPKYKRVQMKLEVVLHVPATIR